LKKRENLNLLIHMVEVVAVVVKLPKKISNPRRSTRNTKRSTRVAKEVKEKVVKEKAAAAKEAAAKVEVEKVVKLPKILTSPTLLIKSGTATRNMEDMVDMEAMEEKIPLDYPAISMISGTLKE